MVQIPVWLAYIGDNPEVVPPVPVEIGIPVPTGKVLIGPMVVPLLILVDRTVGPPEVAFPAEVGGTMIVGCWVRGSVVVPLLIVVLFPVGKTVLGFSLVVGFPLVVGSSVVVGLSSVLGSLVVVGLSLSVGLFVVDSSDSPVVEVSVLPAVVETEVGSWAAEVLEVEGVTETDFVKEIGELGGLPNGRQT